MTTYSPDAVVSVDPSTGDIVAEVARASTPEDVDRACHLAETAQAPLEALGRDGRARLLRAAADGLEARREEIVVLGMRETALARPRLEGELTRTAYQARLFADVVEEGGYLEATIDHAGPTPMGPSPDLRRMLVAIGPVAVFGASNFPLAFSVPGGDTVAAVAAGCPVVLKAHPSHPALSEFTFEVLQQAASAVGAPDGTFGLVHGLAAGAALVQHPAIRAVGFTGSLGGGQALVDLIGRRSEPIPFFGELSSLNPIVLTRAAVDERAAEIAAGLVASVTGSGGQLCTKPGLVLVPRSEAGDRLVAEAGSLLSAQPASTLLNASIARTYDQAGQTMAGLPGVQIVATGASREGTGSAVAARLLEVDAGAFRDSEVEECFGPTTVLVRYDAGELRDLVAALPGSLTATVHRHREEDVSELVDLLRPKAGRLLFNGYPTGVMVSWAQHHGGPWPSTNTQHTSVGPTSIRRFLRPLTWQDAPVEVLPAELRDDVDSLPRRVDGQLRLSR